MAIVVESEQGNRMNIAGILGWMFVITLLGIAAYYIFFKRPELISFQVPATHKDEFDIVKRISELRINPEKIKANPFFSGRTAEMPLTIPVIPGRQNPFLP